MCPHLFAHTCECLCGRSKRVFVCVGGFHTLGLHRSEGPAQELLIERDLRDMAGVSMLRHAETGLWWAVKTSRRLSTTSVFIHACVCLAACVEASVFAVLWWCAESGLWIYVHTLCVILRCWCLVQKMRIALSSDNDMTKNPRLLNSRRIQQVTGICKNTAL